MKIASDDLGLFGSLAVLAIGAAIVTLSSTGREWLALGMALIVFALPTTILVFMAASAEETE